MSSGRPSSRRSPSPTGTWLDRLRARLGRSMRSAGSWVEGRDPASLAGRLDKGEIVWRAFLDAGAAMRQRRRFAEADRMLEQGLGAFPGDGALLYEYALSAHDSGRYAAAVARWEAVRRDAAKFAPDRAAMGWSGLAANLRALGDLARARSVIGEARRLYPDDLVVLSEAARVAEVDGDLEEALALWRTALASPDPPLEWVQGEIAVLVRLGRFEEAARALAVGQERFDAPPGLLGAEGLLASARGEWARAVEIWTGYLDHFPEDQGGLDQLAAATAALRAGSRAAARRHAPPDGSRDVLGAFESLGESCEFATVQRRCGVEPTGLLSWSTVTLDALLRALDQRFAGIGEAEHSRIVARDDGGWVFRDGCWPLDIDAAAFAGIPAGEGPARLADACRHIVTLRDRSLADLAAAEKLFVYRSDSLDGDGLEALHRALAAYGPVRLLCVQAAAPTAPSLLQGQAGEVVRVEPNRFVGFLERFAGGETPAVEDWVALCRKTLGMA